MAPDPGLSKWCVTSRTAPLRFAVSIEEKEGAKQRRRQEEADSLSPGPLSLSF